MIIRINNKSKNFYAHLGKIFGSREVERVTHDRMYDDDNKEWYIYFEKGKPMAFVSVVNNIIKNVWTYKEKYLVEVLIKIKNDIQVKESTVTKAFKDEYIKAGYIIVENTTKNFIKIRGEKIEEN